MEPTMMTVAQFCSYAALGRTTTFNLIRNGKLTIAKVGSRTLITIDSAKAFLESSLVRGEAN